MTAPIKTAAAAAAPLLSNRSTTSTTRSRGTTTTAAAAAAAAAPPTAAPPPFTKMSWFHRAVAAAFRGGISGMLAMVLQVVLLMWLRTVVNYQYRHGVSVVTAFHILYAEGGIRRFYRGATVALLTGPIARFGDTAANEGIQELFAGGAVPVGLVTLLASLTAAVWRVCITPLDTIKTTLQVSGTHGWTTLLRKIHTTGIRVLWDGAVGNWLGTLVGHYPWFIVNNWLEKRIPQPTKPKPTSTSNAHSEQQQQQQQYQRRTLVRRACIGFCCSVVSDCISNGIRVLKTYKQTADVPVGYVEAFHELWTESGILFLVRGLGMKLVSNGLSGILFSVVWKMLMEHMKTREKTNNSTNNSTTTTSTGTLMTEESKTK